MLNTINKTAANPLAKPMAHFPTTGLVRLKSIIAPGGPLPISKSSWWAGVKDGRYPKSRKISARVTAWRAEDILQLLEKIEQGEA